MTNGQVVSSGGDPTSTEVTIDPDNSAGVVYHFGSTKGTKVGGVAEFTGGCESGTCTILFSRIVIQPYDFELTVGGLPIDVENVTIESIGTISVTSVDGEFTIAPEQLSLLVNGDVDASHQTLVATPDQYVSGFYLPSTGMFGLSATFSLGEDLNVEFTFESTLMSRAPVADGEAPATVYADSSGYALVMLDGTGSSDLDNDLTDIDWYEGSTYLGSIAPSVYLSTGVHDLTVYAVDATGKWSSANRTVTVLQGSP